MHIEFDVDLDQKDLFRFNIFQAYTGFQGWVSNVLGLIVIGLGVYAAVSGAMDPESTVPIGSVVAYVVIGLFVIAYVPWDLWRRSKNTFKKSSDLSNRLHFEMTDNGIYVTQGEDAADLPWKGVFKIKASKKQILIYSDRSHAYIIPRAQVEDQYEQIKELIGTALPAFCAKLK